MGGLLVTHDAGNEIIWLLRYEAVDGPIPQGCLPLWCDEKKVVPSFPFRLCCRVWLCRGFREIEKDSYSSCGIWFL